MAPQVSPTAYGSTYETFVLPDADYPYYLTAEGWPEFLANTGDDGDDTEHRIPTVYTADCQRAAFIVVHEIDRAYGGAEEGGWWYDTGRAELSVVVRDLAEARDVYAKLVYAYEINVPCRRCGVDRDDHPTHETWEEHGDNPEIVCYHYTRPDVGSVIYSGGAYRVSLSRRPAEDYPTDRPRYE